MNKSIFVFALALSLATSVFAQSGAGLGSISGVVQDASGSAVPGATVVVSNDAKGIRRNLETTSGGQFTAPALIPDNGYKVTVSKAGFANYEATNITLAVGQNAVLHIPMEVAATATTVDVTATASTASAVDTTGTQAHRFYRVLRLP